MSLDWICSEYQLRKRYNNHIFEWGGAANVPWTAVDMLGRKQSLKGEQVLADYGPEESLNESADIEWVNKVGRNDTFYKWFFKRMYLDYSCGWGDWCACVR